MKGYSLIRKQFRCLKFDDRNNGSKNLKTVFGALGKTIWKSD